MTTGPHKKKKRAPFSKKTWAELEDIWPRDMRMDMKEVYGVISVMAISMRIMSIRLRERHMDIKKEDIYLLFWIQRCEEARENVATSGYDVGKPMNWNVRLWRVKRSRLLKSQLIEKLPSKTSLLFLWRVTDKGKLLMMEFCEILSQAHRDVKYITSIQPPNIRKNCENWFSLYIADWKVLPLNKNPHENIPPEPLA